MNLARWIRRRPVPHAIMCGAQKVLIGEGHRRWADAVDSVLATEADTFTAVGKDGSLLRTCQRSDVDDLPDDAPDEPPGVTDRQRELAQMSQIIADAYSTAHDHARENSARGYELLAKFAELSFKRLADIESAYAKLLNAHARSLEAAAESKGDGLDDAITGIVGQAMGIGKPTAAPGGNGKGTP